MITEEASASPLTLTAGEEAPKFTDLLWHCFGGGLDVPEVPRSQIRLLRPDRARLRHIGNWLAASTGGAPYKNKEA